MQKETATRMERVVVFLVLDETEVRRNDMQVQMTAATHERRSELPTFFTPTAWMEQRETQSISPI